MNGRALTKTDVEAMIDSTEQKSEVPRDAEDRLLCALPGLFEDALARVKLGGLLEEMEHEIEVPARAEERALVSILGIAVIPSSQPTSFGTVPPVSGERLSQPWAGDEEQPLTEVKSRS